MKYHPEKTVVLNQCLWHSSVSRKALTGFTHLYKNIQLCNKEARRDKKRIQGVSVCLGLHAYQEERTKVRRESSWWKCYFCTIEAAAAGI